LEVADEGVGHEGEREQENATDVELWPRRDVCEREDDQTERQHEGRSVFERRVSLSQQEDTADHHWDHLGRLEHDLKERISLSSARDAHSVNINIVSIRMS